jgi:hypothetical protein
MLCQGTSVESTRHFLNLTLCASTPNCVFCRSYQHLVLSFAKVTSLLMDLKGLGTHTHNGQGCLVQPIGFCRNEHVWFPN